MVRLILLFQLISFILSGQSLTAPKQNALNGLMDFSNQTAEQANELTEHVHRLYSDVAQIRKNERRSLANYTCPLQWNEATFQKTIQDVASLGSGQEIIKVRTLAETTRASYKDLDRTCKDLEIYFRLEDYKRDSFKRFDELVAQVITKNQAFVSSREALNEQLFSIYGQQQPYPVSNPYHKVAELMREQLKREKAVIDSWSFNLSSGTHSGWPVEALRAHVLENDRWVENFKRNIPTIKYPASSMVSSFAEGLESLQQTKRSGIDGYTFEKRSSDNHSNQLYLDLINYYNGVCVSFYNQFIRYATNDGFRGVYAPVYGQVFQIQTKAVESSVQVAPFTDKPHRPIAVVPVNSPVSANTFKSLSNYIEFINEGLRQIHNMMQPVRNLNGSAVYAKQGLAEGKKSNLTYYHTNFQLPLTLFETTIQESKNVTAPYQESLNEQIEVLNGILKELDQWNSVLLTETAAKNLHKDSLNFVFDFLKRYEYLVAAFDEKKEQLYFDIRSIYDSYKVADPKNSWVVSGRSLLNQADLDREQLFAARNYFWGKGEFTPATEKMDQHFRDLITDEYTNLTGIQKIGRNNGLCPYSPYEDVAEYSKRFSDQINAVKTKKTDNPNRHPYNELIYVYNSIVDEHNRFAGLSKVLLLKDVKQPELFRVQFPELKKPEVKPVTDSLMVRSMKGYAVNNLVLLLDVSGSMNGPGKLPLLKKSFTDLVSIMRPEDQVAIVIFSTKGKVVLTSTSFSNTDKIRKVIEGLKPVGNTDGNAGLKLAFEVADKNYIRGGNNRIILATDGEFPVSEASQSLVSSFAQKDIFITVFNFNPSQAPGRTLEKLAELGKGNYKRVTSGNVDESLLTEVKAKKQ